MAEHDLALAAFLAGDLDRATERAVDEHLLSCDQCWLAVREDRAGRALVAALREPTSPVLVDRIRLAVELAPSPQPMQLTRRVRRRRELPLPGVIAAVGAVVLAIVAVIARTPQQHATARDSAALREVVALAQQLPSSHTVDAASPVAVGAPRTLRMPNSAITLQTYAFDSRAAVLATATRPFAEPSNARQISGAAMPWAVSRGTVTLYCPQANVLLAGPESVDQLAALARALHVT